jgi:hypothetical protein
MVDSTKNTFILDPEKIKRYYSDFINIMAAMARAFNSIIFKKGDSLIYYFPEASDSANMSAFKLVLECAK